MDVRARTVRLAVLVALPVVALSAFALAQEIPRFFDPCWTWGSTGGTLAIPREGPCRAGVGGTSETREAAALRLFVIHGGALAAVSLGVLGAVRGVAAGPVAAAWAFAVLAVPLVFGLFLAVALLFSAAWLAVAREVRPWPAHVRWAARGLGLAGAAAGAFFVVAIATNTGQGTLPAIAFAIPLVAATGTLAWAGLAPIR